MYVEAANAARLNKPTFSLEKMKEVFIMATKFILTAQSADESFYVRWAISAHLMILKDFIMRQPK